MRVVETPFSRLTLRDDGILEAQPLRTEYPRTGELLSETMDAIEELVGGEPRPIVWNPTGTLPLRPRGWHAIVDRMARLVTALAIVVDEADQHLLGAFPETIGSLLVPLRVFPTEIEASQWLLQFVDPTLNLD